MKFTFLCKIFFCHISKMSNSNYSKLDNTLVGSSALASSSFKFAMPLSNVRIVSGRFYPRAVGFYPLRGRTGESINASEHVALNEGEVIIAATLVGTSALTSYTGAGSILKLGATPITGPIGPVTGNAITGAGYLLGSLTSSVSAATGALLLLNSASGCAGNIYPCLHVGFTGPGITGGVIDANILALNVLQAPTN